MSEFTYSSPEVVQPATLLQLTDRARSIIQASGQHFPSFFGITPDTLLSETVLTEPNLFAANPNCSTKLVIQEVIGDSVHDTETLFRIGYHEMDAHGEYTENRFYILIQRTDMPEAFFVRYEGVEYGHDKMTALSEANAQAVLKDFSHFATV